MCLAQSLFIYSLKWFQKIIYYDWNRVLVLKIVLNFLFIFKSKERNNNFLNSLFNKDFFEILFSSDNYGNYLQCLPGISNVFFIIFKFIFIDLFMLLIILSICIVHDISKRNIRGIIKVDCHFLSGTCKLKEEEMVKNSHNKVKSIILSRNERFKRFLKFIKLLEIILNVTFNNNKNYQKSNKIHQFGVLQSNYV